MLKLVSGLMLALLLASLLVGAFEIKPVKATGTICIRVDGSIDPPTAPICSSDNVTYMFTDNIEFDKSIFVERDSIVIDGVGYTVEGAGTEVGIHVIGRTNVTIKNVKVEMREYGIYLWESTHCSIIGSNIASNGWGIALYPHAHYNSIVGNNMTANYWCGIWGGEERCSSNHNMISENNIAGSNQGIYLAGSWNNSIIGNNITGIGQTGICLDWCSAFNILGNNVTHYQNGMGLYKSSNCSIVGNDIARDNGYGIITVQSSDNVIYHNSFLNNTNEVLVSDSANVWDDGYPSGGNYWSDVARVDFFSGPYQNETGCDGIVDAPYVIDTYNQDRYPLMKPWSAHDVGITSGTASKTVVGKGFNVTFSIMIFNYGNGTENFNLTAYANTTVIYTAANLVLASSNFTMISFSWNTSGFARACTISANITSVEGEADLSDNTFMYGTVRVSCIGDISGDYVTDAKDYQLVKKAIPSTPGSPKWNPNADVNNDLVVSAKDYQIVKTHIPSQLP